jgi:hypothetical protein
MKLIRTGDGGTRELQGKEGGEEWQKEDEDM